MICLALRSLSFFMVRGYLPAAGANYFLGELFEQLPHEPDQQGLDGDYRQRDTKPFRKAPELCFFNGRFFQFFMDGCFHRFG